MCVYCCCCCWLWDVWAVYLPPVSVDCNTVCPSTSTWYHWWLKDNDTLPEWVMQWYRWHCLFVVSKSSWELKWITERVTNLIARENCHIYGAKGNEWLWNRNELYEWKELLLNMNKVVTLNFIELSFKFRWHLMFIYSFMINQSNRIVYGAYYLQVFSLTLLANASESTQHR